jgi:hypothetical protein
MIIAKRELIAVELKRRLVAAFPNTTFFEGNGGIWGTWTRELPCIHIFEQTATVLGSNTRNIGVYTNTLPVQIEYVSRLQNRSQLFTEGRKKLEQLKKALELDVRFVQNAGLSQPGLELAVSYLMTTNEIVEVIPNVIDVAVLYEFQFVEPFYGYKST